MMRSIARTLQEEFRRLEIDERLRYSQAKKIGGRALRRGGRATQNQTWPLQLREMVSMTMDLEGQSGATVMEMEERKNGS